MTHDRYVPFVLALAFSLLATTARAQSSDDETPPAEGTLEQTGVEEPRSADASDPSNTVSFARIILEYQRISTPDGDAHAYGLRLQPKLGFSQSGFMFLELSAYYADNSAVDDRTSMVGLGDLRLQGFYLPYLNPNQGGALMNFGLSLDIVMPAGSGTAGLGGSRWVVAPGLLVGLHPLRPLLLFPIVSYSASIPGEPDSGLDTIHAIKVLLYIVLKLPLGFYLQVIPDYLQPLNGDLTPFFNTEFVAGWQRPGLISVDVRYRREFVAGNGMIDRAGASVTFFF
jgi:hypothetical protein